MVIKWLGCVSDIVKNEFQVVNTEYEIKELKSKFNNCPELEQFKSFFVNNEEVYGSPARVPASYELIYKIEREGK